MKPQLFFFHYAGGNSFSFQFITSMLNEFDVFSLELPGRGRRCNEDLVRDFEIAALDLYTQVKSRLKDVPFMIYGHSMGAYLAFKVAWMLENEGRKPVVIIVSGNAGPGLNLNKKTYLLEKKDFMIELAKLGGAPAEFLEDDELFEFFEPILRADFEISERNTLDNFNVVGFPIYALMGSSESNCDQIANWGKFTKSTFAYDILEGDHFFLYHHPSKIISVITSCYSNSKITTN